MSNVHGLHSIRNRDNRANDSDDDDSNDRYVGGVDSRGGGSGLAVVPNQDGQDASDAIFNLADPSSASGGSGSGGGGGGDIRRTITMYRSGFTVDDGPYRRLDDPANAEFLTSLARGLVPRELSQEAAENGGEGEVMVGLVDRRGEEYDPERHAQRGGRRGRGGGEAAGFQSFSGEGQSLGASSGGAPASSNAGGVIDPTSVENSGNPPQVDSSRPCTSIAIRLLNGKRLVVKINLDSPVSALGQHIGTQAGEDRYVLTAGYPPAVIEDLGKTVEEAGLKGAQVVLKKA
ncbi:hypothetical protein ACHAXS_006930 [Conticribra weissflogii]